VHGREAATTLLDLSVKVREVPVNLALDLLALYVDTPNDSKMEDANPLLTPAAKSLDCNMVARLHLRGPCRLRTVPPAKAPNALPDKALILGVDTPP
jgi:hypothetical protein